MRSLSLHQLSTNFPNRFMLCRLLSLGSRAVRHTQELSSLSITRAVDKLPGSKEVAFLPPVEPEIAAIIA